MQVAYEHFKKLKAEQEEQCATENIVKRIRTLRERIRGSKNVAARQVDVCLLTTMVALQFEVIKASSCESQ